ncbi:hypothetical protein SAMN04487964_1204 [Marinobacterium sediminicola]|uniref:Uncharacterized protein n=1 Tax=Marinobacterium sediminicola TaxID=518898 RepID=A0ABY1S431_9GAMM|nr:hypothetical protein SAMN04487964_1204 [Marinobacterium sediminicola]
MLFMLFMLFGPVQTFSISQGWALFNFSLNFYCKNGDIDLSYMKAPETHQRHPIPL